MSRFGVGGRAPAPNRGTRLLILFSPVAASISMKLHRRPNLVFKSSALILEYGKYCIGKLNSHTLLPLNCKIELIPKTLLLNLN